MVIRAEGEFLHSVIKFFKTINIRAATVDFKRCVDVLVQALIFSGGVVCILFFFLGIAGLFRLTERVLIVFSHRARVNEFVFGTNMFTWY